MTLTRTPRLVAGVAAALLVLGPAPAHAAARHPAASAGPASATLAGPPGPPQGTLPQTGCQRAAGTATCDLWAKPGSVVLPGAATPVPIWGFASTDAAAATLPGPVLVVDQGDQVTITVHNGLTDNLSLAFPAVTGLAPDRTGAAPGAARSYTFTAARPGTYLYQAGHTEYGARQVAMGLVGALVVRAPAVGGRPSAYGDTASTYDDEAVLVLTEVDPAFNAAPRTYDMRAYAPKYRLINGKPFPETDVVATDVGRRVLLRYVAAGLQPHPMTLLGLDQAVVGQDARPAAYPEAAVTLPLQPGQAVDAVVDVPTGPDGRRFALYESGGQLNNAGQRYGSTVNGVSPQQAFGGMLTFLDTNPPPISGDHTGPTSANVRVTPNPASVLNTITVTADFTDARNGNSVVDRAEAVVDDLRIAEGTGVPFTAAGFGVGPTVVGATAVLPGDLLGTLTQGRHTVWVRGHDVAGNWGVVGSTTLNLAVTGAVTTAVSLSPNPTNGTGDIAISATGDDRGLGGTVTDAEYFVDATGPSGSGRPLTLANPGAAVSAESGGIPAVVAAALAEGRHSVQVHTRDSFNFWGPYGSVDLVVDRTVPTLLSAAVDPAVTDGRTGSASDPAHLRINAAFTDPVGGGVHSTIAGVEGFLDVGGADGTGFTFLALDGSFNSATENTYGLLPLSELTGVADGTHRVLVHARDSAGNWGPLAAVTFVLDRTGPVITALTATPNPTARAATLSLAATATDVSAVTAAEWYEGTDPGVGHGHPMTVSGSAVSATVALNGFSKGNHTLWVRARDALGHWGTAASVTVNVDPPDAIFSDGFSSGTSAWSQVSGTVSVSAGQLVAGTVGYVVDDTPAAERTIHTKADVILGTFNPQTAVVTVHQLRNAAGSPLAVVQYQRGNGVNQFRLGLLRPTGWAYTGWVNASGGTVRLDWTSATTGSATLRVGTATIGTLTGDTSGYTVESAALGLVARTATTTGSLSFDNYASTRYTAP
ncbi:multicopper oxidase domain-containing protein [Micromonospora eburnea]|uniref:Multicopper oxidase with three cupredoxin domains (Includes cell division protein FtsP and spore coat protein CotA) n=1 Tax=Micromonospora eburnea TaxID=227316 RepID=A0A1C6UEY0_9ACTN|nr:multicopper oxidase domain-containing protein [Micromonospora eburnea]SCL52607.1 Multicopper oxidase with three cupredoxin domains (includes cell division protein FtsP and spore coat protein CotA) [Micromonospora eburnea]